MAKPKRPRVSADEQQILDHLEVRLLNSPKCNAQCDELLVAHHYLHEATLVGEQLRCAATYKGQSLAVATWRGAAFHLKDRDEFIGWDFEQCRRRRPLLANNSRLLVLSECHSPNLVSRLMKLMLGRLSQDWLERWGGASCRAGGNLCRSAVLSGHGLKGHRLVAPGKSGRLETRCR